MARIRSIKPEFWTSEQVAECSPNARLLFIGMWSFCDDSGIHPASTKRLKMEVYPADDFSDTQMKAMVAELTTHGLLTEYDAAGESYWRVTGWKHQKIDQPTYKHPLPSGVVPSTPYRRRDGNERSPNTQRTSAERSIPEGKGVDVDLEVEGGSTPRHPLQCAHRMIEILSLTSSFKLKETIAAAVQAEASYLGTTTEDASQQIANHAMRDRKRGLAIDKFYFEDTKWRNGNGVKRQTSPVETRVSGNREVLAEVARAITAQRVGSDGNELEDGTRAPLKRGVRAGAV